MKAVIEFDVDDESKMFKICCNAKKLFDIVVEFDAHMKEQSQEVNTELLSDDQLEMHLNTNQLWRSIIRDKLNVDKIDSF